MVKKELVDKLAADLSIPNCESRHIIEEILGMLMTELKQGNKVVITNFGTFELKFRKARIGRNPSTNKPIYLRESPTILFKVSKKWKKEIVQTN